MWGLYEENRKNMGLLGKISKTWGLWGGIDGAVRPLRTTNTFNPGGTRINDMCACASATFDMVEKVEKRGVIGGRS